ncbi:MAG: cell division protein CrgA [Acidimicrobiaceae bacterium]
MATKKKKGGRVTPKGGHASPTNMHGVNNESVGASTRYTPPSAAQHKQPSPQWMLYVLFGLLGFGALIIFLYYVGFVPGGRSNWYLAAGLVSLLGGLYTATKYQ